MMKGKSHLSRNLRTIVGKVPWNTVKRLRAPYRKVVYPLQGQGFRYSIILFYYPVYLCLFSLLNNSKNLIFRVATPTTGKKINSTQIRWLQKEHKCSDRQSEVQVNTIVFFLIICKQPIIVIAIWHCSKSIYLPAILWLLVTIKTIYIVR